MNENKVATKALLKIDANIDNLVKQIELLSYVNPTNIEEQKQKFFASKYSINPSSHIQILILIVLNYTENCFRNL